MKPTILIVEDDPQNRKLLAELLALKGNRILDAPDGKAGVALAYAERPDLILMDIQMPEMDGFGAIQELKGDVRTRAIPIWVLTSYAMPGDQARIIASGCDAYITKPLDLRDLLTRIERQFGATNPDES